MRSENWLLLYGVGCIGLAVLMHLLGAEIAAHVYIAAALVIFSRFCPPLGGDDE